MTKKTEVWFEYEGNGAIFINQFHIWRKSKKLAKKGIVITNWGIR